MVNIKLLLLLFLTFPLLKIEATLAQNTQPRQTPTINLTNIGLARFPPRIY